MRYPPEIQVAVIWVVKAPVDPKNLLVKVLF